MVRLRFYAIIFCIIVIIPLFAQAGANSGICNTDDEISSNILKDIKKTAIPFVESLTKLEDSKAYPLLAKDVTKTMTKETFSTIVRHMMPAADTVFQNIHIAHIYLDSEINIGTPTFAPCTEIAHGTISKLVFIETKLSKQAYVIVEANTKNNKMAFLLLLIPEDKKWSIGYFQLFPTDMVGYSPEDLWALGQKEKNKNHNFNAYILSVTALQLTNRGPHFRLGIQSKYVERIKTLEAPKELQGNPPFTLKSKNKSFKILSLGPIGINKKIYLIIRQEIQQWVDDKEADNQNHELILVFLKEFPEYKDIFSGLVIEAVEPNGPKGYRTIYEN